MKTIKYSEADLNMNPDHQMNFKTLKAPRLELKEDLKFNRTDTFD